MNSGVHAETLSSGGIVSFLYLSVILQRCCTLCPGPHEGSMGDVREEAFVQPWQVVHDQCLPPSLRCVQWCLVVKVQ